ncbi:MAG TPA: MFS transporter, partial [Puia sp.]|nr:MFS transporter [Puia sp.]
MKTDQSVRSVDTLSPAAFTRTTTSTIASQPQHGKHDQRRWWNLFVILLAPVISVVDIFITNVSLPTIQSYYKTSDAKVQLIVAAYLIGYAVFLITGSRLGDKFGRKKVLIIGLSAFTITSVLCGLAVTIGQLILFRFLQGISAAFMVPQTVTLIHLNFPEGNDRHKAFGYYGIAQGIGAILGQFLGGYFIHAAWISASWRLIFLVNLPIGVIAAILAGISLKES